MSKATAKLLLHSLSPAFSEQQQGERELTPILAAVVVDLAQHGECCYDWNIVKPVLRLKMDQVLAEYENTWPDCADVPGESFADQRTRLHEALEQFQGIPFTVQRYAELLCEPKSMYSSTRKLVSALDKVLAISTTIPQYDPRGTTDETAVA